MKKPLSQAYLISLQLYVNCTSKGQLKRVTLEQYSELSYQRVDSGLRAQFIPESITILATDLFTTQKFSARALTLIQKIIGELCINNTLWYFDHLTSSRDRSAIAELRNAGILMRTEEATIHYVDPSKIRRGSPVQVLACTTKELQGVSRVTRDNIRNLGFREKSISLNPFDINSLPAPE